MATTWDTAGSFDDRLRTANLAISALAESLFDGDAMRTRSEATRLQRALEVVERSAIAIGVGDVERHAMAAAVLYQLQRVAHPLLAQSGVAITQRFLVRLRLDVPERTRRVRRHG